MLGAFLDKERKRIVGDSSLFVAVFSYCSHLPTIGKCWFTKCPFSNTISLDVLCYMIAASSIVVTLGTFLDKVNSRRFVTLPAKQFVHTFYVSVSVGSKDFPSAKL